MAPHQTIGFRRDEEKVAALYELAESADRDRSYLLNDAVANDLELQEYHTRLVKEGLEAVKKGRTIEAAEVRKRIAKLARGRRARGRFDGPVRPRGSCKSSTIT
jgi:predicted transcriptional regulator